MGQPRNSKTNESKVLKKYPNLIEQESKKETTWKNFKSGEIEVVNSGKRKPNKIELWVNGFVPYKFLKYDAIDKNSGEYIEIKENYKKTKDRKTGEIKGILFSEQGKLATRNDVANLLKHYAGVKLTPAQKRDKYYLAKLLYYNKFVIDEWNKLMTKNFKFMKNEINIDHNIKNFAGFKKIYTLDKIYDINDFEYFPLLKENQNIGVGKEYFTNQNLPYITGHRIEIHMKLKQ